MKNSAATLAGAKRQRADEEELRPPKKSAGSSGSAQPPLRASNGPVPSGRLHHPFPANFNDHFETSLAALRDVLPVVTELRQLTRPSTPELFTLYDPYYCNGAVAAHWATLGVCKVLHENRDFYKDIREHTVPGPYDMIVTNPPFSEGHIQRMLEFFVQGQDRPWAFLGPDYIVSKQWYRELIRKHFTAAPPSGKGKLRPAASSPAPRVAPPPFLRRDDAPPPSATVGSEPFYIIPKVRYDFQHPTGAGHAHSHFKSMWFVWPGRRLPEVLRGTSVALLSGSDTATPARDRVGAVRSGREHQQQQQHAPVVVHGLAAVDESGLVASTDHRPNPQRRQQQQQQRGRR